MNELTLTTNGTLLSSYAKQLKDSIKQYKLGGKYDLVKKELFEFAIIKKYFPKNLSEKLLEKLFPQNVNLHYLKL